MDYQKAVNKLVELASEYGLKVLGAILIWIIGSWVIKRLMQALTRIMDKSDYDAGLKKFLLSIAGAILKVLLVLAVLGNLGVETTSLLL